jgi:protocatechuate 3,4-dioxygenase beta subunit
MSKPVSREYFQFKQDVISHLQSIRLPDAYLTIWNCNATGSYSGFTGISPDTVELIDGYTKNADGTTDEE